MEIKKTSKFLGCSEMKNISDIHEHAAKEMKRMHEVMQHVKVKEDKQAKHFHSFAMNYFKDGIYFFKEKKYTEAFEAFIIAWAYIDTGLKLKFFQVPREQKKWFTA